MEMQFSHTRRFPPLGNSTRSPPNVFAGKVSGTQSGATDYHPEQDIIETHNHYSLATHNESGFSARLKPHPQVVLRTQKHGGAFVTD
jgi:hypothetical protein